MTDMRDDEFKGQPTMLGDCACGCMNDPDFASPPDGLPDRLAIARDDLRRESARTEMAFRERDAYKAALERIAATDGRKAGRFAVKVLAGQEMAALTTESALKRTTPECRCGVDSTKLPHDPCCPAVLRPPTPEGGATDG